MIETSKIIEAINTIHQSLDIGFDEVYKKLDERFKNCDDRVTQIEREIAIRKALCKKEKEVQKSKKDYWLPVIRAVTIVGVISLLGIAIKLILFGITLPIY